MGTEERIQDMTPKKTTNQIAYELQQRLVQECIKFAREKKISINIVSFSADCMRESIQCGSWQPSTDSSLELVYNDENGELLESFSM